MSPEIPVVFQHPNNHCPAKKDPEKFRIILLVDLPEQKSLPIQTVIELTEAQNQTASLICHGCGAAYQPKISLPQPPAGELQQIRKSILASGALPAYKLK